MSGKKDCKFCEKNGLLWLPLRYSVVGSDYPTAFDRLPEIGGKKLGKGVVDIKLTDPKSKYAVRLLRPGYLYLLLDHRGLRYWRAYQVLDDANLYEFDVDNPPQIEPQFSCDPILCGVNASVVSIPDPRNVKKMFALFTHAPLTKAKLSEYRASADAYAREGKMQTFSPADWLNGDTEQLHSLLGAELLTTVAEYRLFTEPGNPASPHARPFATPLSQALNEQMIPATRDAYGVAIPNEKGVYGGRMGALQDLIKRNGYAAFVLYDHIGITQELNDFRNDAFMPIDAFMGQRDGPGPDNRRKFDVYNEITEWRQLMEKGLVTNAEHSVEQADYLRRVQREPLFIDDSKTMLADKAAKSGVVPTVRERQKFPRRKEWESAHPAIVEELERERQVDEDSYIEFAQNKAKNDWRDRYAPHLDLMEMERFIAKMNGISKQSQTNANTRAAQHISWLKSERVIRALDVCDQEDPISGEALSAQIFQCIFGMEGCAETERVLTDWATAIHVERENLFLRAFTRDQKGVKEELDKSLSEVPEQTTGTTEFTVGPATSSTTASKGVVAAMKATDSALDEWMRQQGQSKSYLNPKHIANVEARFFYLVSTVTRAVARKGIGSMLEMKLVGRANVLLMSRLGDLAAKLEHDTLTAQIDPSKWNDIKQKHKQAEVQARAAEARKTAQQRKAYRLAKRAKAQLENAALDLISDAQCKAKLHVAAGAKSLGWNALQGDLEESAKQHRNYKDVAKNLEGKKTSAERIPSSPSPTNNYHQVRLGGALAAIESLSLYSKIKEMKEPGFNIATGEIIASAASLSSILADMMYAYTKSVRELPNYIAIDGIKQGADIVRGGFKLIAGSLALLAGVSTVLIEYRKAKNEHDPFLQGILYARSFHGGASTIFGALAAFSYTGPLLNHLAKKHSRAVYVSKRLNAAGTLANALVDRVTLLRTVAWLGWVGVIITVADLAVAGYRWHVEYTAITRWLSRCTFRKMKTNKCFNSRCEELEELRKALQPRSGI
ncbi:MAG: T6SS effector BTH_I2691 family protein [Pseudomonadota bacterium]